MRLSGLVVILIVVGLAAPVAAQTYVARDCPHCPEMVSIPLGVFTMGVTPTELGRLGEVEDGTAFSAPPHKVTIGRAFSLGKYEVTKAQYAAFVTATKREAETPCSVLGTDLQWDQQEGRDWREPGFAQTDSDPVVCVSANGAVAYAAWLSSVTGRRYRLPSEAEWEYAARAGTRTSRYWGEDLAAACRYANVADLSAAAKFGWKRTAPYHHDCTDGYVYTAPIGRFAANGFGLHDMIGNAWEWVGDCASFGYIDAPADQSYAMEAPGTSCNSRIARGGGWSLYPLGAHAAKRLEMGDSTTLDYIGFRVARWD